ncbi:calcium/sodium antiporter [Sinomicrobium sp. M5D2P9]
MYLLIAIFAFGLLILIFGAHALVEGASALARRFRVPDILIGLTIVAFGTSAPELVVNVMAASKGFDDIVYGNIIGSNNFNLFIILGICGLIRPLSVTSNTALKEIPFSLILTAVLLFLVNDRLLYGSAENSLVRWEGVLLLLVFSGFLFYIYKQLMSAREDDIVEVKTNFSTGRIVLYLILGLAGLIFGGQLVVTQAREIAQSLGVSDKIISLTIVAAGTSLPELATSVVSVYKRNIDLAVGNVVGSNIFNLLLILGTSALISPINYHTDFNTEVYILAGGSTFLFLAMFTGKRKKVDRWEAIVLLVFYVSYMAYLVHKTL